MRRHPYFSILWYAVHVSLALAFLFTILGLVWEQSTESYLRGFADAVVPSSASPEDRVEAILAWMDHGPARARGQPPDAAPRNPQETLNYRELLRICGSATNAFVNLSHSAGLHSRRLLLLDPRRGAKHVVAEVLLDGRWVVVDPAFHVIFRDASGQMLTRIQLRDPAVFREAIGRIPGYPASYDFGETVHVRLSRIPFVGRYVRRALDTVLPGWEEAVNWTLVLERKSLAFLFASVGMTCLALLLRVALGWFATRRLGIEQVPFHKRYGRASAAVPASESQEEQASARQV